MSRIAVAAIALAAALSIGAAPEQRIVVNGVVLGEQLTRKQLTEWLAAATHHTPGTFDDAAHTIHLWPRIAAAAVGEFLPTLAQCIATERISPPIDRVRYGPGDLGDLLGLAADERARHDASRILRLGALLHTDIAVLGGPTETNAPGGIFWGGEVVSMQDGTVAARLTRGPHWSIASKLVIAADQFAAPGTPPVAPGWFQAAVTHLCRDGDLAQGRPLAYEAQAHFPNDARLVFEAGAVHEMLANPWAQAARHTPAINLDIGSSKDEWQRAQALFRRAMEIDPAFSEAHLRLGRVEGELGRHVEAAVELKQSLVHPVDATAVYWAQLFLGRELEETSDPAGAHDAYAAAEALFPSAQSAQLALSALAFRQGVSGDANRDGLEAVLAMAAAKRDDPWWDYERGHARDADRLLAATRRALAGDAAR